MARVQKSKVNRHFLSKKVWYLWNVYCWINVVFNRLFFVSSGLFWRKSDGTLPLGKLKYTLLQLQCLATIHRNLSTLERTFSFYWIRPIYNILLPRPVNMMYGGCLGIEEVLLNHSIILFQLFIIIITVLTVITIHYFVKNPLLWRIINCYRIDTDQFVVTN